MMHLCGDIKAIYTAGEKDVVIHRVVACEDYYYLMGYKFLYQRVPELKDFFSRFKLPEYPKTITEEELGVVYKLDLSPSLENGLRVLANRASFVDNFCALGCTTKDIFDTIGCKDLPSLSYDCYRVVNLVGDWEFLDKIGIVAGSEICFLDGKVEDYEFRDRYFLYNYNGERHIAWVRRQGIHMYIESARYV